MSVAEAQKRKEQVHEEATAAAAVETKDESKNEVDSGHISPEQAPNLPLAILRSVNNNLDSIKKMEEDLESTRAELAIFKPLRKHRGRVTALKPLIITGCTTSINLSPTLTPLIDQHL